MPWTPSVSLLGTVVENQSFNYTVRYYTEEAGAIDPITGLPGPSTQTYYNVNIVPATVKSTVTITNGSTASIAGYFQRVFNDTIQYRDHNGIIKTLTGDASQGSWDKLNLADVYHITSFQPDTVRDMTVSYTANAVNGVGTVIASQGFTIRINDPSWDAGKTALRNALNATEK